MARTAVEDAATERRAPQVAQGVSYIVAVIAGLDAGKSVALDPDRPARVLIGKSPACDLVLTDPLVSRRHVALETAGLRVGVNDLESTNGTLVNDVVMTSGYLVGGETLRVGDTTIHVEARVAAPAADETPMLASFGRMVGACPKMCVVYTLASRLATTAIPVVIEGETGTGKELLAECMHEAGPRAQAPFVVFDASATPRASAAEVLFGDRNTAGLFELAHDGTLFVDEVGALDFDTQGLLLRSLERGEVRRPGDEQVRRVNVRVIAATSRDVDKLVDDGKLREELFFRLAVGRIELPPLRRRKEDLPALVRHLWRSTTGRDEIPPEFSERYVGYDWPGNVRELANALTRLAALGETASLMPQRRRQRTDQAASSAPSSATDLLGAILAADLPFSQARQRAIEVFERAYVTRVLAQHGGNVARSAAASGIARRYFQTLRARQSR